MTPSLVPEVGVAQARGTSLARGEGAGSFLRLEVPLSFWGGTDDRGTIVDGTHPQRGRSLTGKVIGMRSGRGSSSSSSVLAEHIRSGVAPAAILLEEPDPIVVLGALVAAELYGRRVPVILVDPDVMNGWTTTTHLHVHATADEAVLEVRPEQTTPEEA